MPANIPDLPAYTVLTARETEHDYHIRVETTSPRAVCDACKTSPVVGYGRIEVLVHDLPMNGKRVGINQLFLFSAATYNLVRMRRLLA